MYRHPPWNLLRLSGKTSSKAFYPFDSWTNHRLTFHVQNAVENHNSIPQNSTSSQTDEVMLFYKHFKAKLTLPGGRTAWSASVEISGKTIPARLWYDGQYLHNAREDAAEVAVKLFQPQNSAYSHRWQTPINHHRHHRNRPPFIYSVRHIKQYICKITMRRGR